MEDDDSEHEEVEPLDEDEDEEHIDEEVDLQPNSKPPEVPEDGTYITALNEAGVDPERIE